MIVSIAIYALSNTYAISIKSDQKILNFRRMDEVSINTAHGRIRIPMGIVKYGKIPFERIRGQCDLVKKNKIFHLMVVVEIPEEPIVEPMDIIGVDIGIANIAMDSTGKYYSGDQIKDVREHSAYLCSRLQSAGTKSAKRHLQKLSGKERGLARNTNHVISKEIVQKAKGTSSAIAMENLECVRMRITVRKGNRYIHNSCSFHQIRLFKEYKGKRSGHLPHRGQPAQHQQGMPQLSLN